MFCLLAFHCEAQTKVRTATVDFQLRVNLIIVKVTVNGVSKNLVLDTGASSTVIDNETADQLGLKRIGEADAIVGGGKIRVLMLQVDTIRIDSLVLHDFICGAADIGSIKLLLGEDISGVLGFDFLSKFKITIDYQGRRILFNLYEEIPGDTTGIVGDTCWIPKFGNIVKPGPSWEFSTGTPHRQIKLILYNTLMTGTAQIQDHELALGGIPLESIMPQIEQQLRSQISEFEKISGTTSQLKGKEVYVLEYKGWQEGTNLRFKHIFVKVKDNLFCIQCCAPISVFALLRQDFDRIIDIIQFAK